MIHNQYDTEIIEYDSEIRENSIVIAYNAYTVHGLYIVMGIHGSFKNASCRRVTF